MNGYQITFLSPGSPLQRQADRRWLLQLVKELGLRGASLHAGGESFARGGRMHSAHFFELADQPVEVLIAVTTEEATRLFDRLKAEGVHLFYVKTPVEFGVLGREPRPRLARRRRRSSRKVIRVSVSVAPCEPRIAGATQCRR